MSSPWRAPRIVAGIALGLVVPIAFGSYQLFTRPFADVVSIGDEPSFLPVAIGAGVLAVLGWVIAAGGSRVRPFRAVLAWAAVLFGTAVFALAAQRAEDVDRDRLVRDMPVVGEIGFFGAPLKVGALTVEVRRLPEPVAALDSGADSSGRSFSCQVRIATPGRLDTLVAVGAYLGCQRVRVRADEANGIAVIENIPLWANPSSDAWQRLAVHSTTDGRPMSLDVKALRRSLAVPTEWAALTAFAMAIGFTFLLAALSARRREAKFGPLVDAVHVGDGWFAVRDGRRIHASWAGELPLGEFSVRLTEPSEAPTYRESAAAVVEPIARGAASVHARKARGLLAACEAIALTTAALGMAPALVALYILRY